jgi:uroporphyrinogen III methyltransferase/synthase
MERLELFDSIVFFSANGVDAFFRALRLSGRDSRSLAGKTTAVIGPATGEALARHGILADVTAGRFIAEGLLETLLASADVRGVRYLLVRSDIGRDILRKGLRDAGAVVEEASFYSTCAEELAPHVRERILSGELDVITFTSSSTVASFFDRMRADNLPQKTLIASIGPQTSKAITGYGRAPDIEAGMYTVDGLVEAILARYRGEKTVRE